MDKKKSVLDFFKMKEEGEKITFLTCEQVTEPGRSTSKKLKVYPKQSPTRPVSLSPNYHDFGILKILTISE